MASIIDSIRSVQSDKYSVIKLGAFSYVIYMIYKLILPNDGLSFYNGMVFLIILLVYLGFVTIIISNRINQRIETLPLFDVNLYTEVSFKSLALSVPYFVAGYFIGNMVVSMFSFEGIPQLIALWLIRFCIFCIYVSSLINYADKYKIQDAINVNKITNGASDVIVGTILAVIILGIMSAFTVGPLLYLIYTFYKIGTLFEVVAAYAVTMNIAVLADFWGQLHYDISSRDNYY